MIIFYLIEYMIGKSKDYYTTVFIGAFTPVNVEASDDTARLPEVLRTGAVRGSILVPWRVVRLG
jgi:hypothetical protein